MTLLHLICLGGIAADLDDMGEIRRASFVRGVADGLAGDPPRPGVDADPNYHNYILGFRAARNNPFGDASR